MPVDVGEKYIRIRQRQPGKFQEKTFRTKWFSKKEGIKAIVGRPKGKKTTQVQSLLFDRKKWSPANIVKWLEKHKDEFPYIPSVEEIEDAVRRREKEDLKEKLKDKAI